MQKNSTCLIYTLFLRPFGKAIKSSFDDVVMITDMIICSVIFVVCVQLRFGILSRCATCNIVQIFETIAISRIVKFYLSDGIYFSFLNYFIKVELNFSFLEYNLHNFYPFGQEKYKPQNFVKIILWNKKLSLMSLIIVQLGIIVQAWIFGLFQ